MVKRLELKVAKRNTKFPIVKLQSSRDTAEFFRQLFKDDLEIYESFFMATVSSAMEIVGYVKLSQGGKTSTILDGKLVAKFAVDTMARGVVLCHNHPSGSSKPSNADRIMTRRVKEILSLFEIDVLDHIVLTASDFYSFADNSEI